MDGSFGTTWKPEFEGHLKHHMRMLLGRAQDAGMPAEHAVPFLMSMVIGEIAMMDDAGDREKAIASALNNFGPSVRRERIAIDAELADRALEFAQWEAQQPKGRVLPFKRS